MHFFFQTRYSLRGNDDKTEHNFMQLIKLRAIHQSELLKWLERKTNQYTQP